MLDLALEGHGDAHAVHRETMDEVGGAVQRINDPDVVRMLGAVRVAGFLGQDAVAGVGRQKRLDDGLLCGVIHLGHEVVHLLLRNTHRLHVECGAVDDGASGACGLDGHVKHGVQVGRHGLCEEGRWPGQEARGGTGDAVGNWKRALILPAARRRAAGGVVRQGRRSRSDSPTVTRWMRPLLPTEYSTYSCLRRLGAGSVPARSLLASTLSRPS